MTVYVSVTRGPGDWLSPDAQPHHIIDLAASMLGFIHASSIYKLAKECVDDDSIPTTVKDFVLTLIQAVPIATSGVSPDTTWPDIECGPLTLDRLTQGSEFAERRQLRHYPAGTRREALFESEFARLAAVATQIEIVDGYAQSALLDRNRSWFLQRLMHVAKCPITLHSEFRAIKVDGSIPTPKEYKQIVEGILSDYVRQSNYSSGLDLRLYYESPFFHARIITFHFDNGLANNSISLRLDKGLDTFQVSPLIKSEEFPLATPSFSAGYIGSIRAKCRLVGDPISISN